MAERPPPSQEPPRNSFAESIEQELGVSAVAIGGGAVVNLITDLATSNNYDAVYIAAKTLAHLAIIGGALGIADAGRRVAHFAENHTHPHFHPTQAPLRHRHGPKDLDLPEPPKELTPAERNKKYIEDWFYKNAQRTKFRLELDDIPIGQYAKNRLSRSAEPTAFKPFTLAGLRVFEHYGFQRTAVGTKYPWWEDVRLYGPKSRAEVAEALKSTQIQIGDTVVPTTKTEVVQMKKHGVIFEA